MTMTSEETRLLPASVVDAEKAMAVTGFDSLGHMRWYWTADPENPHKVTYSQYARQTGVSQQSVYESVQRRSATTGAPVVAVRPSPGSGTRPKAEPVAAPPAPLRAVPDRPERMDDPTGVIGATVLMVEQMGILARQVMALGQPEPDVAETIKSEARDAIKHLELLIKHLGDTP